MDGEVVSIGEAGLGVEVVTLAGSTIVSAGKDAAALVNRIRFALRDNEAPFAGTGVVLASGDGFGDGGYSGRKL